MYPTPWLSEFMVWKKIVLTKNCINNCLNKLKRPLHSKITSKSKDQATSFAKLIVAKIFVYISFATIKVAIFWLWSNKQKAAFFKIFWSISQKYSAALQESQLTMQNQNKFKKIKESDRNEKIELWCCLTKNRLIGM